MEITKEYQEYLKGILLAMVCVPFVMYRFRTEFGIEPREIPTILVPAMAISLIVGYWMHH